MDPITLSAAAAIIASVVTKIGEGSLAKAGELITEQTLEKGKNLLKMLKITAPSTVTAIEQIQSLSPVDLGQVQLEPIAEQILAVAQENPEIATEVEVIARTVVRQVMASGIEIEKNVVLRGLKQEAEDQAIQDLASRLRVGGSLTLENITQVSKSFADQTLASGLVVGEDLVIEGLTQIQGQ